jgi:glycosyltransferase involved in cell wall biosynthesis
MSSVPRVLFLCQNLPYPPHGGALIRSYHTLRLLSEQFDVEAYFFFRRALRPDPDSVAQGLGALKPFGAVQAFPIAGEWSVPRNLLDHARSVAAGRAYTRWVYDSKAVHEAVGKAVSTGRVDLVHLDSLDLVAYLPDLRDLPVVVAHHNVESQLLKRRGEREGGVRGAYIRRQAALTQREEARWCPRVALNCVASEEDGAVLEELAPGSRCIVVPNGVDTGAFRPATSGAPGSDVVFVGGNSWFPNRDGMDYFAEEVLPLLRQERPEIRVTWVGRANEEVKDRFAGFGITVTGYVDDIRPYVYDAACFIAPLRVGGGTRLKILDAWALGKAVVSTSQGAEGLAIEPGRNILIADSARAFADEVARVLDDSDLRHRLEQNGRETAVEVYDWSVISGTMSAAYRELLER